MAKSKAALLSPNPSKIKSDRFHRIEFGGTVQLEKHCVFPQIFPKNANKVYCKDKVINQE
jgi:hypothetical protein